MTLPGTSDAQLTAAHCFSLTSCVVAGITTPATGNTSAESLLLASWNGKAFTPQRAGAVSLRLRWRHRRVMLLAVALRRVGVNIEDAKAATMSGFAEVWNGATWTATKWTGPKGSTIAALYGVSCTSATSCVAVGAAGNAAGPARRRALLQRHQVVGASRCRAPARPLVRLRGRELPEARPLRGHRPVRQVRSSAEGKPLAGDWNGKAWKLKAA